LKQLLLGINSSKVNLKDSKIGSEIQSGAGILLFPISNNIMLLIMEIIYVSQELSRIFDCVGSLSSYSKRQKKKSCWAAVENSECCLRDAETIIRYSKMARSEFS
jgi:hypothetical protein